MRHATDIKIGKTEYADDYIKYNGETFPRETRNGKDMILVYGEWKEAGDEGFPWEVDANNGIVQKLNYEYISKYIFRWS